MTDLTQTLDGLSALAQEIRLNTFRMLMSAGPEGLTAGSISGELDVAPNKLSAHLSILSQAGLISARRSGRNMIYSADVDAVASLLTRLIETCCDNNPGVCRALAEVTGSKVDCC